MKWLIVVPIIPLYNYCQKSFFITITISFLSFCNSGCSGGCECNCKGTIEMFSTGETCQFLLKDGTSGITIQSGWVLANNSYSVTEVTEGGYRILFKNGSRQNEVLVSVNDCETTRVEASTY